MGVTYMTGFWRQRIIPQGITFFGTPNTTFSKFSKFMKILNWNVKECYFRTLKIVISTKNTAEIITENTRIFELCTQEVNVLYRKIDSSNFLWKRKYVGSKYITRKRLANSYVTIERIIYRMKMTISLLLLRKWINEYNT